MSLRDARELVRQERARIESGIDVSAAKQAEKALVLEVPTVQGLGEVRNARCIQPSYEHPEVVACVLRKHINPVLGSVAPQDVQPTHIDHVLTRIVAGGAPTVANDTLRYMSRMFRMAMHNQWIDRNRRPLGCSIQATTFLTRGHRIKSTLATSPRQSPADAAAAARQVPGLNLAP